MWSAGAGSFGGEVAKNGDPGTRPRPPRGQPRLAGQRGPAAPLLVLAGPVGVGVAVPGGVSGHPDPDAWVPRTEAAEVPPWVEQLCRRCPVRAACRQAAVASGSTGYWAASTTRQRKAAG
jgi:Transcription factor WhiB